MKIPKNTKFSLECYSCQAIFDWKYKGHTQQTDIETDILISGCESSQYRKMNLHRAGLSGLNLICIFVQAGHK